jgi:hypothetical protein
LLLILLFLPLQGKYIFMKKITLFIALQMIAFIGFSQEKVRIGLHGGLNVSSLAYKISGVSLGFGSQAGFFGGVDVTLPAAPDFVIQPELSFSQMGGKINLSNTTTNPIISKVVFTLNYLSLPVLFKYKIPNSGLGIYAGPQYSYLVKGYESVIAHVAVSAKDVINSSDFSGIIGAEYYLPKGFGISARYQAGFINIGKDVSSGESVKNNGFTFTLGYRY